MTVFNVFTPSGSELVSADSWELDDGVLLFSTGQRPSTVRMFNRQEWLRVNLVSQPQDATAPTRRLWNNITLGDGSEATLIPAGAMLRIKNPDGTLHCWHSDAEQCVRAGHETITTYYLKERDD